MNYYVYTIHYVTLEYGLSYKVYDLRHYHAAGSLIGEWCIYIDGNGYQFMFYTHQKGLELSKIEKISKYLKS